MAPDAVDDVLYEVAERVATVTLNRPDKLNAMTPGMQQRFVSALRTADLDPEVRAVVVTGAGRGFCAGADLGSLSHLTGTYGEGADWPTEEPAVALDAPLRMSTPVIAAVNGAVAGMGFSYMLMADLRYASDTARIGSTFARLGLVAEWGAAPLLTALVGSAHAADLLLSGRIVDADEALSMGLVQRVLAAEELLPAAYSWAHDVAANCSPRSHATMKRQLRAAVGQDSLVGFQESVADMLESFGWPDLAEGVAAKLSKRTVNFPPHQPA